MTKPFIFTLFGSTGDLAQKKIMPALLKLFVEGRLAQEFSIIAFSRRPWSNEQYHAFIMPLLTKGSDNQQKIQEFLSHVVYTEGHFDDGEAYHKLQGMIESFDVTGTFEKLYYLSVQPEFYENILSGLTNMKLLNDATSRILVEKPFGHDVASSEALEKTFEDKVRPEQLLRIDHYLAKEGFRKLVSEKGNLQNVRSVRAQIFETIGIEGRGDFYETTGALRDVGQNHLLEMVGALLADQAKSENEGRAEAISSLKIIGEPVFGQYEGYKDDPEVHPESKTETYFKLQAESTLEQWKGIPIILEGGKAMAEKRADIVVTFADETEKVFDVQANPSGRDAYEVLIEQAIAGERAYFASFEEIHAAWVVVEPLLKKYGTVEIQNYPKGTNGPKS